MRSEKTSIITELRNKVQDSSFLIFADYRGLNVGKTEDQLKAEAEAASGAAKAVRGPIKYKVSMGGREHSVSVEMA